MTTPYNNKVAVWYVHGRTVGETTIDGIIDTLKQYAPAVTSIFVKIGEANEWMGNIGVGDPKVDLAIRGPADIDRWVRKLGNAGLELHAWHIPKGNNPAAEADLMIQACSRPGVRSLILDVEPFEGYFSGGRTAVRPLMSRLRAGLPASFHVGMSVDPRPWHYDSIFPDEWKPFIGSIHPQIYWADFSRSPDSAFQLSYQRWGSFGLPIIPVLQGYQGRGDRLTVNDMSRARTIAIETYKVPGLSWFRFGTLNRTTFEAVNVTMSGIVPGGGEPKPGGEGKYGIEIVVRPSDPGFREGTYDGSPSPLRPFQNEEGWLSKYFFTNATASNVWARWDPKLPGGGLWEISVYTPSQHASTLNARYKIHGIVNQPSELEVAVAQTKMDSLWVPLGVFNFDGSRPNVGVVFMNDLTGESGREIAFDAVRWRQVLAWQNPPRYLADGFDAPVGTSEERALISSTWPPMWLSTNPYANRYSLLGRESLHTGDDLVLRRGKTLGQMVFAAASGIVTSARREGKPPNWGSWGNVIVIRHDPLISNGRVVYTRYAHVDNMQVVPGERVVRGQHIADISDAFGVFRNVPHLHFDVSPTRILESAPGDWPWLDRPRLERDYSNPRLWIVNNRPAKP